MTRFGGVEDLLDATEDDGGGGRVGFKGKGEAAGRDQGFCGESSCLLLGWLFNLVPVLDCMFL